MPARRKTKTSKAGRRVVRQWRQARPILERWRREATSVHVELRRPRVIDVVPIDFLRGEPAEQPGTPTSNFRATLLFFTGADLTFRRPSGAILVVDLYEIAALSAGDTRVEPAI
jgi:hypothetical protein